MKRCTRIVLHNVDSFLSNYVATVILLKFDAPLQGHAEIAGLVVVMKKFLGGMDFIDVLPSAAGIRFKKRWESNVIEYLFPIQRVDQIAHRAIRRSLWMLVVRQNYRRGDGHAQFMG